MGKGIQFGNEGFALLNFALKGYIFKLVNFRFMFCLFGFVNDL